MAHGFTVSRTYDGFIDEIVRRDRDRGDALEALSRACVTHPELDADQDIVEAVNATDMRMSSGWQADSPGAGSGKAVPRSRRTDPLRTRQHPETRA